MYYRPTAAVPHRAARKKKQNTQSICWELIQFVYVFLVRRGVASLSLFDATHTRAWAFECDGRLHYVTLSCWWFIELMSEWVGERILRFHTHIHTHVQRQISDLNCIISFQMPLNRSISWLNFSDFVYVAYFDYKIIFHGFCYAHLNGHFGIGGFFCGNNYYDVKCDWPTSVVIVLTQRWWWSCSISIGTIADCNLSHKTDILWFIWFRLENIFI